MASISRQRKTVNRPLAGVARGSGGWCIVPPKIELRSTTHGRQERSPPWHLPKVNHTNALLSDVNARAFSPAITAVEGFCARSYSACRLSTL